MTKIQQITRDARIAQHLLVEVFRVKQPEGPLYLVRRYIDGALLFGCEDKSEANETARAIEAGLIEEYNE